jgi:long-subunit fatty acid transport protein
LRTGVAYDTTPVPDATRMPAIGAGWQPSQALAIDVGYVHLFIDILSAHLTHRFK